MSEHYIQNDVVCIPLGSREWIDYKEYLESKLAELEEQKKNIEARIAEIHRILNPVIIPQVKKEEEEETALPEKEFYSVDELSNLIGIHRTCINDACIRGSIPFTPYGENRRKFSEEQVEEIRKGMEEGKYFSSKKNFPPPAPLENEIPACDVRRMLNCGEESLRTLRSHGEISVIRKDYTYAYYDKTTVLELAETIKQYDGIKNYLKTRKKTIATPKENISLKELAVKVNVSESTLYDNCVAGKIPCHRANGIWEFTPEDVEKIRSMKGHGQLPADSCQPPAASRKRNTFQIEGKCTCKDIRERLSINGTEYNYLVYHGYLNGNPLSGEKKKGNPLYYDVNEVDALVDMMEADGGKDAFFLKLRRGV